MDIEKVLEMGYECCACRPKDATPPHMVLAAQSDSQDQGNFYMGRTRVEVENVKVSWKVAVAKCSRSLPGISRLDI